MAKKIENPIHELQTAVRDLDNYRNQREANSLPDMPLYEAELEFSVKVWRRALDKLPVSRIIL